MTFVVVVADNIDEQGLQQLERDPDFEVIVTAGFPDQLKAAMPRAHALLVRSSTRVTEKLLANAPNLRVIGRAGIGVDNIDVKAATRHGIAVINAPGANTVSAAEHTFALLLALVRKVPWAQESLRNGEWDRKRFGGRELRGKVLGLVGLGRIGAHVTGIARAFGMEVIAYDPFLSTKHAKQLGVSLTQLDDLLARADVVSLHAPLNDETRHLINGRRLAVMKPTAVVINAARGGLIDDDALVEALENGRLGGAALDVFDPEPLPDDSPLRTCDRIILTPHLAASTKEAQIRVAVEISQSIRAALRTGDVGGAVNVPGLSQEVAARARPTLQLSRRVGYLAAIMAGDSVRSIEVDYGGKDDGAPKPVMLSAVEGVLQAAGVKRVSLVNASVLAEQRDIGVSRRIRKPAAGFETTVGVTVQTAEGKTTVVGAMLGNTKARIVRIDEYDVDIAPEGDLLILKNRDVPGVIGRVGTVLGEGNVNIGAYHQARLPRDDAEALAAIAVDQPPPPTVLQLLKELPDVVEVWVARLGT